MCSANGDNINSEKKKKKKKKKKHTHTHTKRKTMLAMIFRSQFCKIILRYIKIGYNINVIRQTACLEVNPITVIGVALSTHVRMCGACVRNFFYDKVALT